MAGPEAVVLARRGPLSGTDRYGAPTYGPEVTESVPGVFVAQASSTEPDEVGRADVITELDLYLPGGFPAGPWDHVEVRGDRYELDAQPADWMSGFTTWQPGMVVRAKRVQG